MGKTKILI